MECRRTKDIIHVKENILSHRSILNIMIYIHLEKAIFGSTEVNEYHVIVAKNIEEAYELVKGGFEYVTGDYNDGGKGLPKKQIEEGHVENTNDTLKMLMKGLYLGFCKGMTAKRARGAAWIR